MPEAIKGMFFTDKFRTIVTFILLCVILVVLLGSWAYPKRSGVDEATIDTLKDVSQQIQRAADNLERQSTNTLVLNRELSDQLKKAEVRRDEDYKQLLERYGLDPEGVSGNSTLLRDGDYLGLRTPDDDYRGIDLPPGAGTADGNQQLQAADESHQGAAHSSGTGGIGSQSGDAPKPAGKTDHVPTGIRLHPTSS